MVHIEAIVQNAQLAMTIFISSQQFKIDLFTVVCLVVCL